MENPKLRILVVEDDEATSLYIEEVLKKEGYETIVVNDSSKVIEIANSAVPQAFLLDLMMPPDGFRLCRMLRKDPIFSLTPMLIVTALNDMDSKIVAIGAGANDYLVKPFCGKELVSKMNELFKDGKKN